VHAANIIKPTKTRINRKNYTFWVINHLRVEQLKNLKIDPVRYLGLKLTIHVIKSQSNSWNSPFKAECVIVAQYKMVTKQWMVMRVPAGNMKLACQQNYESVQKFTSEENQLKLNTGMSRNIFDKEDLCYDIKL
jgi:hypothetical protein